MSTKPDQPTDGSAEESPKGQVSEVSGMSGDPEPIDPSDATAGTPDGESGSPQEGQAGPNAAPRENVESADH